MDQFEAIFEGSEIVGGVFERTIDKNNRFVIPSELRNELPCNTVIRIMKNPSAAKNKCLYAYSEKEWKRLCIDFKSKLKNNEEGRLKARAFASSFVPGKIDVSGRFTLDKELREYAGITDKLMIVSTFGHIEIWSIDNLEKEKADMAAVDFTDMDVDF